MPAPIKRPQLRTCTWCKKPGHNASTCPTKSLINPPQHNSSIISEEPAPNEHIASPNTLAKSPAMPVRFFVHHVAYESQSSPHVIDLKKESSTVWDTVEAVAPSPISSPEARLYAGYTPVSPLTQIINPINQAAAPEQSANNVAHTETTTQPPASTIVPEKNEILDKKSVTIQIPTIHFSALGKKIEHSVSYQLRKTSERVNQRISTWRATENRVQKLSTQQTLQEEEASFLAEQLTPHEETAKTPAHQTPPKQRFSVWPRFLAETSSWHRRLAFSLAVLLIISIIPTQANSYYQTLQKTKSTIAEKSTAGFLALQESTGALLNANLNEAQDSTVQALDNFASAVTIMNDHAYVQKLVSIIPVLGDEVKSRQELIRAGQKISLGNTYLIKGVNESLKTNNEALLDKLGILMLHVRSALPHYQEARRSLDRVSPSDLPLQYQKSFGEFKTIFTAAIHDFEQIGNLGNTLQDLFGGRGLRRYLLVFQNPAEMRATGGFIGSFAEIDIKDGRINKFVVPPGGSYDVQGQLRTFIEPPTPLLMANKRWEFQDANWFPDFPASAEKLLWFYRHSDRGSVDGIIAINASVLERLLSIIGPITDSKRGITLDESNALFTLQGIVEEGSEKKIHKPKQILSDFSHIFLNYFSSLTPKDLLPMLVNLKEALDEKEVQVYLADEDHQRSIAGFGWSGALLSTTPEQDYLMVVNSNILGEKSDARIKQKVQHQVVVDEHGEITNTVTISREHTGTPGEKFYGKPNIDYVRIYVPKGSTLLEAKGFSWPDEKNFRAPDVWTKPDESLSAVEKTVGIDEKTGTHITEEFGKYAFGNWIVTEPGKISQVQIIYRLPFTISNLTKEVGANSNLLSTVLGPQTTVSTYQLIVQKQSGMHSGFESTVIFPLSWTPVWKDGDNMEIAKNGATIRTADLEKDTVWSLAMKKL